MERLLRQSDEWLTPYELGVGLHYKRAINDAKDCRQEAWVGLNTGSLGRQTTCTKREPQVTAAIYAGPRRVELLRLRWSNVDFDLNRRQFHGNKNQQGPFRANGANRTGSLTGTARSSRRCGIRLHQSGYRNTVYRSRSPSQQHAEKRVSPISPFMTCVTMPSSA